MKSDFYVVMRYCFSRCPDIRSFPIQIDVFVVAVFFLTYDFVLAMHHLFVVHQHLYRRSSFLKIKHESMDNYAAET